MTNSTTPIIKDDAVYDETYWNSKGTYQKEYDVLKKLIPRSGESSHKGIELLRCISNLYYDLYNNGGCNWPQIHDQRQKLRNAGYPVIKNIGVQQMEDMIDSLIKKIIDGEYNKR